MWVWGAYMRASEIMTNKMKINEIVPLRACVCIPRHCLWLGARAYMHSIMVNARGEYSKFYLIPFRCCDEERFNGLPSSVCAGRFYASKCECVFCLTSTFVGSYNPAVRCCLVVLLRLVRLTSQCTFQSMHFVGFFFFFTFMLFEKQNATYRVNSILICYSKHGIIKFNACPFHAALFAQK